MSTIRAPKLRALAKLACALGLGWSQGACTSAAGPAPVSSPKPQTQLEDESNQCTVAGPELCFNGWDDNCNGPIDEGCGVEGGMIQFIAAWDPPEADVDLEVRDPEGTLVEVGRTTATGLTRDRDCPGKGECGVRSFENVFLVDEHRVERGTYRVIVRLERWTELDQSVRVNLSARLGQQRYATRLQLAQERDENRFSWTF
jgi:hypothetical protein